MSSGKCRAVSISHEGASGATQEIDAATIGVLRATSFSEEQVLGEWFPEEPRVSDE